MASQDDLLFGQLAVKRTIAKADHVSQCLQIQAQEKKSGAAKRAIGQIMVERGFITHAQVEMILEVQRELSAPKMIGPYQLLSKLGEGGMGAVYKAVLPASGLEVALKILPRKFSSESTYVTRFQREASVGMGLDHPNIVRTLDVGEAKGMHFIALELVEGGDLNRRLKKRGIFPENEALGIVREVALGLQHAHEKGLVHRDIKPANILFDSTGRAKISDLGLVKMTDPEAAHLTQTGVAIGTPHYIAPEQARGDGDIDIRADIYALGATLYRMVTGKTPFEGANAVEIITKHLSQQLVAPDEINPQVGDGCTALIEKMMAKERDDRYPRPADLIHDIDLVLAGKPPDSSLDIGKSSVQISANRRARAPGYRTVHASHRNTSGRQEEGREAASLAARRPSSIPMWAVAGAGAIVLIVAAIALGGSHSKPVKPQTPAAPVSQADPPKRVPDAPVTPNPSPAPARPVSAPAPARAAAEDPAQAAFDAVLKVADPAGQKAGLESFLKDHGDSIAAARARVLLAELSRPPAARPEPAAAAKTEDPNRFKDALDLLALIDPNADAFSRRWTRAGAVLTCEKGVFPDAPWSSIEIPYQPPDEYDLLISFNRTDGDNMLGITLPRNDREFSFVVSAGNTSGFDKADGKGCGVNSAGRTITMNFENNRTYTCVVHVRNDGASASIDGKILTEWKTDYKDVGRPKDPPQRRHQAALGIAIWMSSFSFDQIKLVEVSGKGTFVRPDNPQAKAALEQQAKGAGPKQAAELARGPTPSSLAECFALLGNGKAAEALALAKKDASPQALALARVLERAKTLFELALSNISKKPPAEPIDVPKMKISGVIARIEGRRVFVKSQGVELPVDAGQLPIPVLLKALALDESKPEGAADKAALLIAFSDIEGAKALLPRIDAEKFSDIHAVIGALSSLERQKSFNAALDAAEQNMERLDAKAAAELVASIDKKFADVKDTQKERLERLSMRAQSKRTVAMLKIAFSGEVLKAEDSGYVEVRYDAKKGADVWKDFQPGANWQIGGGGPSAESRQMEGKNLSYLPRFLPGTLRVEFLLVSGFHDIFLINVGSVHAKARWFGDGNILISYEPAFTRNVNDGPAWDKPKNFGGEYRYVVERTPDAARLSIENKEHVKLPISPDALKKEGPATISLWSWGEVTVKEFIVKGTIDPEWLKAAAGRAGEK